MYLEEISGTVIGLVFTWFIFSMITMQIQEWIASSMQWRANDLQQSIRGMLGSENLMNLFYDHSIIRSLSAGNKKRDAKPSYIPANQFSAILLGIVQNFVHDDAILIYGLYGLPAALRQIKSRRRRQRARDDLDRIYAIARLMTSVQDNKQLHDLFLVTLEKEIIELGERDFEIKKATQALLEEARTNKIKLGDAIKLVPELNDAPAQTRTLLTGVLALGAISPELKTTLDTLLSGLKNPNQDPPDFLGHVRANIETWFNDSMDRISGWYKRKAQISTFIIGLVCAGLLNVDSLSLAAQLWREPVLRDLVANNANLVLSQYTDENGYLDVEAISTIQLLQDQYLNIPIGWSFSAITPLPPQACSFSPAPGDVFGFRLRDACFRPTGTRDTTHGWGWLFLKVAGLFVTGLALAQGSSFWFDILSTVINVRSAGKRPV